MTVEMIAMQIYLLATIFLIITLDLASAAARFEMYSGLRYLKNDGVYEISAGTWSSICFYLIPSYKFIKLTKILPLTYLFDRKIRSMLKGKTYEGRDVLERIEYVKNLKWEDIRHLKISIT